MKKKIDGNLKSFSFNVKLYICVLEYKMAFEWAIILYFGIKFQNFALFFCLAVADADKLIPIFKLIDTMAGMADF